MNIKPMIRSNICINAHPTGCAKETERQIDFVRSKKATRKIDSGQVPHAVLVLGCSTGYGLASRITAAFEYGAATVGVSFEKAGSETRGGTPGWYNNRAFDRAAAAANIPSVTLNGDAFSDAVRQEVIAEAKRLGVTFDLVVYSLASPVRTDPDSGVLYQSVLKPFGKPFSGQTVDALTGKITEITVSPANDDEAAQTVKVMGGEDWERWMQHLSGAGVLSRGCKTVAYSYIGPALSHAIYRDGTIGRAKQHLEETARRMDSGLMHTLAGRAFVSINKGLVTRSSAVIPIIPLYLAVLFKVMKDRGVHEGCIEQIERLFTERLYTASGTIPVDAESLIRIDDYEMDDAVQNEVSKCLAGVTEETLPLVGDLAGYRHDFLAANGFDVAGVDYSADVARMDEI